jgi:DNA-binding NarL/FixJ family response regulator
MRSAWEIGQILTVSKRTVDEHAQTAMRKLGAASRTRPWRSRYATGCSIFEIDGSRHK